MKYTSYGKGLYQIEFREEENGLGRESKKYWTLFKRNFLTAPIDFQGFMCQELHPWNLSGGTVDKEDLITGQTEEFLKFMVDALNEKAEKEKGKMGEVFDAADEAGVYDNVEDDSYYGGNIKVNTGL